MTYNPKGESDSGSDEGGLVPRERRERLNMSRALARAMGDQIEADWELAEKIQEEERAKIPTPIEVPGDAEFAKRLHEELN